MATPAFPLSDAQVFATLAAIAYAGDEKNNANPSIETLHGSIARQLNARPTYATAHDWHLSWGPVESRIGDNLIFATYNEKSETLAIVFRGTTSQTWSRFEDIPRSQTLFPAGNSTGAAVSTQMLEGLRAVLKVADKWEGETLAQFFMRFSKTTALSKVVVCGHSQGAALTPMMMLALQEGLLGAPKVDIPVSGFAIAPPTSGNPEFAAMADDVLDCWYVINPLDIVPLGYNRMSDVYEKGIPEPLGFLEKPGIEFAVAAVNLIAEHAGTWAQPSRQAYLPEIHEVSSGFLEQVGDQHNHNSYLHLLGAVETDVGDASPFDRQKDPVIST
jgi:hypothetical protein